MFCCNRHMGLLKVHLKYEIWGPMGAERDIWDRSHVEFLGIYGTSWNFSFQLETGGPMYGSERPMGPVPFWLFGDLWDFLEFLFSIRNMRSQVWLWETYGISPMYSCQSSMGLVPCNNFCGLWDHYGKIFGPMYVCKRSMGPVPCIAWRDLWDRSHVWLSKTHGTGPIAQLGLHIITSFIYIFNYLSWFVTIYMSLSFTNCYYLLLSVIICYYLSLSVTICKICYYL